MVNKYILFCRFYYFKGEYILVIKFGMFLFEIIDWLNLRMYKFVSRIFVIKFFEIIVFLGYYVIFIGLIL